MNAVTIIPPGQETSGEYHRSGAWGSTLIGHFRHSPRLAHLIHSGAYRPKPTAAMQFGTAFHTLMDPGGNFDTLYRVGPDVDHRTKAWKEAVASAEKDGVTLIGSDDHVDLLAMRASVLANPVAAHLIEDAEHEVGFRMPSGYGNFTIQCRADIFRRGDGISDVKTCTDLDDFAASVTSWGYYRQAALIDIGQRTNANDWDDHHHAEVLEPPNWMLRSQPLANVA